MKSVFALGLALAGGLACAQGGPRPAEQVQIGGKEYLRLSDWARTNGLEVRWLKRDETLQLSSRSARLFLTVDSCEARINGIEVWLLAPIAARNGTAYIAQQDLQSTFHPILSPPRPNPRAGAIKTICLDPGHGGKDPGYCVGANEEKRHTLLLAQELRQQLTRAGFKVTLTRNSDSSVGLPARPELARRRHADLFVSLHFNAAEASPNSVQGTEVYCLTPAGACSTNARGEAGNASWCAGNQFDDKNLCLAYQMQKSLTKNLETHDRGVKRERFAVLRDAVMPAILIEAGFMSHPAEGRKLLEPAYRRQIARAIVEGLVAYKHLVEPADDLKTAKR
ncbi:MAG: N-acetylmuramoyl-L-alanine amidase [Verrucomicrobiota bacterium]|jgi:N-acetylmuramoyl-L-alanine amidase